MTAGPEEAATLGEQEPVGESGLTASEEMVVRHLQPYIAALVATAEERGAQAERERCARLLAEVKASDIPSDDEWGLGWRAGVAESLDRLGYS